MQTDVKNFSTVNIVDCLHQHAKTQPEFPAIEDGVRVVSYQELNRRTDEVACNIRALGIAAGDIVTVILQDSIEHLFVNCGLARAGAVIFSVPTSSSVKEILSAMAEAGSQTLVCDHPNDDMPTMQIYSIAEVCARNGGDFGPAGACGDQPLMLIQSSGTTGKPKSFFSSHMECLYQIVPQPNQDAIRSSERLMSLFDMCFHFSRAMNFSLLGHGATIIMKRCSTAAELVEYANRLRVSYILGTPTDLLSLLDYSSDEEMLLPGLRVFSTGTGPVTSEQRLLARQQITPCFREIYGTNEIGGVARATPEDQDKHPDSVGRVFDDVEVEITDGDGQVLPFDSAGLIRLRSLKMTKGYINNPRMNARHFKDGWFYPGDVAKLNEDGYLFLLGRADDIINSAGVKFYPIEVENVLLSHPAVREAAVVPLPHKLAGQMAGAAIVVESEVTFEQLEKYCAERLAAYKVPYVISFRKTLPRNAMGKVLKRKLVSQFQAQMQAQSEGSNDDRS
jgi:acyl-coenzyme A synthetase/AMP-(fatty) acid ligase